MLRNGLFKRLVVTVAKKIQRQQQQQQQQLQQLTVPSFKQQKPPLTQHLKKQGQQQYTRTVVLSLLRTRSLGEIQAILLSLIKSENLKESLLFAGILDERWERMERESEKSGIQVSLRKNFIIMPQEDGHALRKAISASVGNLGHCHMGYVNDFVSEMTKIMNNFLLLLSKSAKNSSLFQKWTSTFFLTSRYRPNATSFAFIYKHHIPKMAEIMERMLELDIDFKKDVLPLIDPSTHSLLPASLQELARAKQPIDGELDEFVNSVLSAAAASDDAIVQSKNDTDQISTSSSLSMLNTPSITNTTTIENEIPEVKSIESGSNGIHYIKGALSTLRKNKFNHKVSKLQLQESIEADCDVFGFQKAQTKLEQSERFTKGVPFFIKTFLNILSVKIEYALSDSLVFSTLLKPISSNQISLIILNHLFNLSIYQLIDGVHYRRRNCGVGVGGILHVTDNKEKEDELGITMVKMVQSIGDSLQKEIFLKELKQKPLNFLSAMRNDIKRNTLTTKDISLMNSRIRRIFAHEQERTDALEAGWSEAIPLPLRAELVVFLLDLSFKVILFKNVPADHGEHRIIPFIGADGADGVHNIDGLDKTPQTPPQTRLGHRQRKAKLTDDVQKVFQHRIIKLDNDQTIGYLQINRQVYSYLVDLRINSKNFSSVNGKERGVVCDSEIRNGLDGSKALTMPMVVPPKPWLTITSGGYLTQKEFCIRLKSDPVYRAIVQDYDKRGLLDRFLRSVDLLGQVSWQVNVPVLKVALEMWNKGHLISTKLVEQLTTIWNGVGDTAKEISMKCDLNYRLEIARSYVGIPFYFPYNVDFRGRAYPIPALFSHIGNDVSRGLLLFSEAKPLGPDGFRWLLIHLCTSYGFGKRSLDERVKWSEERMDSILRSANDPLDKELWWAKGEEPWQVLACCMEIRDALRNPGGPSSFRSRLPIQQDGSCNGLQHYAALGKDVDGAFQVNVSPSPTPQDVYSEVSRLVEQKISNLCDKSVAECATTTTTTSTDSDTVSESPNRHRNKLKKLEMALILKGKISRKLVKQTVMTNVYGITKFGARQQILNRFDEIEDLIPSVNRGRDDRIELARFLVDLIFDSLGDIFKGAQAIQNWLVESSLEIGLSVSGGEASSKIEESFRKGSKFDAEDPLCRYPQTSVLWTSPLGMPVMQPYLKVKSISVQTILQKLNLKLPSGFDAVDHFKQSSSMPPNFVHSLDASHMLLTAERCFSAGVTFASVHDCFWSHAATVGEMNRLLRLSFVDLHKKPILEDLRNELLQRYKGYVVPVFDKRGTLHKDFRPVKGCGRLLGWRGCVIKQLPPVGSFDVSQVMKSEYFFS